MSHDEELVERVRDALSETDGVDEKRMFGGVAFLVHGHMCCGVNGDELVVRLGKDGTREALTEAHTRPFDMTGKPISTMLFVECAGHAGAAALGAWTGRAVAFARSLPPK